MSCLHLVTTTCFLIPRTINITKISLMTDQTLKCMPWYKNTQLCRLLMNPETLSNRNISLPLDIFKPIDEWHSELLFILHPAPLTKNMCYDKSKTNANQTSCASYYIIPSQLFINIDSPHLRHDKPGPKPKYGWDPSPAVSTSQEFFCSYSSNQSHCPISSAWIIMAIWDLQATISKWPKPLVSYIF